MIPASCCKAWIYYAIFNAIFGPTTALAVSPPERTIGPHATKPGSFPLSPPAGTRGRDLRPMSRTCEGAQPVDCGDPIERLSPATTARNASSPEFTAPRPEPPECMRSWMNVSFQITGGGTMKG